MSTQDQPSHNDGPNWKWWHFILAGLLVGGWSVWQWWETGRIKNLGGLVLAALCILVGLGSRPKKTSS